ncbi:uncharacterized protein LOC123674817 [Harmonia axyridis]|uniref:uncharacterized protein LOC123674817 n=1 Tax=Harmonia axyridis TaxID=115357 RepID=UPI001E2780C8|nr:uncharacterized protein LOC123674817 [Harmonia axyridis]
MFSDSSEEENLDRFKEATDINFFKNSLYKVEDNNVEEEIKVEPLPSLRIKDECDQFKLFNVTPQFQQYVANALSKKIEKYLKENSTVYCEKKKKKRKTTDYIKLLSSSIYPIEIESEKEKVFNTKPKTDEKYTIIKKSLLKSVTITGEEILSKKGTEYWSNRSKATVYNYKESNEGILSFISPEFK